ncbi:hypothetical protein L1049_022611 [Liquidambar formosana]|uniref:Uncharacterized protein n=1 Tax=Liquidambar formosana TaxID=63359 RepID=A0AAP0WNZ3_LIQFO
MGTKLQSAINPLATSPTSGSFTLNSVDDWDYFQGKVLKEKYLQRTGLDKLQDSMDRMLEQHNIESIKKTMLMHEDIFKHQVRELHRLYSLQKMLMDELKKETEQTRLRNPVSDIEINHSNFANRHHQTTQTCGFNLHVQNLRDDPCSREQSGSCSGDNLRMPRCFDLERPADEDMWTRVSPGGEDQAGPSTRRPPANIRTVNDGSDEETEVELTLSIGGSSSRGRLKNQQPHRSLELGCSESSTHNEIKQMDSSSSIKSDRGEECSEPTNTLSSSSATFDQDKKRPHWLFQGLSLNRT